MLKLCHSYESGAPRDFTDSLTLRLLVAEQFCGAMSLSSLNSSKVISVKSLIPLVQECFPMLWFLISRRV